MCALAHGQRRVPFSLRRSIDNQPYSEVESQEMDPMLAAVIDTSYATPQKAGSADAKLEEVSRSKDQPTRRTTRVESIQREKHGTVLEESGRRDLSR